MHEASLVAGLLGRVAEIAAAPARALRVHLRVGVMAGANADAMQFAFEALRGDWLGDQAELVIEHTAGAELDLLAIVVGVQHHHAHAASCAAENEVEGPYLAAVWDGSGYGHDGTVWDGEFFLADGSHFERIAQLRPFRLPGGEAAVREGWRVADSLLWETFGANATGVHPGVHPVIAQMLERNVNAPVTTSVGRLFDAVASLAGVARENRFEGQSAIVPGGCDFLQRRDFRRVVFPIRRRLVVLDSRLHRRRAERGRPRNHRGALPQCPGRVDYRGRHERRCSPGGFKWRRIPEPLHSRDSRGPFRVVRIQGIHSSERPAQRRRTGSRAMAGGN